MSGDPGPHCWQYVTNVLDDFMLQCDKLVEQGLESLVLTVGSMLLKFYMILCYSVTSWLSKVWRSWSSLLAVCY